MLAENRNTTKNIEDALNTGDGSVDFDRRVPRLSLGMTWHCPLQKVSNFELETCLHFHMHRWLLPPHAGLLNYDGQHGTSEEVEVARVDLHSLTVTGTLPSSQARSSSFAPMHTTTGPGSPSRILPTSKSILAFSETPSASSSVLRRENGCTHWCTMVDHRVLGNRSTFGRGGHQSCRI